MANIEDVLKKTEKYDVITFDVFDTLLIRDVMKPVDVFRFSYGELGRYFRVLAEVTARRASKTGEVTLTDIEKKCLFPCKREVQFEKRICRANPIMKSLYDTLKKQGKKMYAISDMYLDKKTISGLLRRAGYDLPVMVSCAEGCDKTSGKLFNLFLHKNSLDASKVLHIGDSKASDCEGARKAGIDCVLINKHANRLAYTKYSKSNYELAAFVNHGLWDEKEPVGKIGYEIIGPIILSFCQWIHRKYKEEGFKRLYFLARDMRFTYEVYRSLYPNDSVHYLCVSRKSLLFARENPKEFCAYLKKEGCYGNVAIVDTGWVGSAQVEIEKYARKIDPSTDIGGLYLGSKLAYRLKQRSARSHVFLFSTGEEQFKSHIYSSFMETLIGCNEKQVIRYENGRPVFDRDEDLDNTNLLKDGARKFISEWVNRKANKTISKKPVRRPFERIFYNPKRKHVDLIGNLHYEDLKDTKIVSYDPKCPYWRKPGKLLSDLGDSAWKGAFLKKFGIWYPLLMISYTVFGSLRIYWADKQKCQKGEL